MLSYEPYSVLIRHSSGYNTDQALLVLPHFTKNPSCGRIRLLSIFFGANDARLPNPGPPEQHVPIERYKENLSKILDSAVLKPHAPKFVLISTPPIDERNSLQQGRLMGFQDPIKMRTAEAAAKYAAVARELGKERGVPVVDLWSAIMAKAGWDGDLSKPLPGSTEAPVNEILQSLLPDGLHFSGETYRILYDEWIKTVIAAYPELAPEALKEPFPLWADEQAWNDFSRQHPL